MEAPVLLLAYTGFIIRNLLLGTFADAVTRRRPLVVAVQNPDDEHLQEIVQGRPITLIRFEEDRPPPPRPLQKLFRWQPYMYRFKEAEKGTASMALQTRLWESRHSAAGEAWIKLLRGTGSVLTAAGAMGTVERRFLEAVGRWPITAQWREVLAEWQPAVVVSTMLTHAGLHAPSIDLPAVVAAQQMSLPVGTLVQSWDNLSSKTAVLPPWLSRYWTWSDHMSRELVEMNPRVPADRVQVVGSPQFDFHLRPGMAEPRGAFMSRLGLDPARPYLLVGTGTVTWMPNEPDTVIRLIDALLRAHPECQVLVRLHPKDDGRRWAGHRPRLEAMGAVFQETSPPVHMDHGGFVPPKEFYREQVTALTHAAVVINTASTLTVDAAILDRPIISLGYDVVPDPLFAEGRAWLYNQSTHFSALVETGGVVVPRSEAECMAAIERYLADPALHRAGRAEIAARVTGVLDGGAGERLAAEVLALAGVEATEVLA